MRLLTFCVLLHCAIALSANFALAEAAPPVPADDALVLDPLTENDAAVQGTCSGGDKISITVTRDEFVLQLSATDCQSGRFHHAINSLVTGDLIRARQTINMIEHRSAAKVSPLTITPPLVDTVRAGDPWIRGTCVKDAMVTLYRNENEAKPFSCTNGNFQEDAAKYRLRAGDRLAAYQSIAKARSGLQEVTVSPSLIRGDEREDFEAGGYVGFAIDSFASDDVQRYLNPEANGTRHERAIFGFDFARRLYGRPDAAPETATASKIQVWVYGETLHGVRSTDVNCAVNTTFPTCLSASQSLANLGQAIPQNALYMLRNASTLEGFMGLRIESPTLNGQSKHPAVAYGKLQVGFISVAGGDGDARDVHQFAFGTLIVGGPWKGSYLEVGHGRTDLFADNRYKRYKIDGHLLHSLGNSGLSLFAQIFADVDMKRGSDSIQHYFGLAFDVSRLVPLGNGN